MLYVDSDALLARFLADDCQRGGTLYHKVSFSACDALYMCLFVCVCVQLCVCMSAYLRDVTLPDPALQGSIMLFA